MMSRTTNADAAPVANKDHWHAALGVNVCGRVAGRTLPTFEDARRHPHATATACIHIDPFLSRAEAGNNATVGRYFKLGGWKRQLRLVQAVGRHRAQERRQVRRQVGIRALGSERRAAVGQRSPDYKPANGDVIALALLPKGDKIGEPPSASELAAPSDLNPTGATPSAPTDTTPPTALPGEPAPTTPAPGDTTATERAMT